MTQKDTYKAEIFKNRISKKFRELKKWARKNRITCFRIYDRDIPEVPLCLDIYEFLPEDVQSPLDCARFISLQNERQAANDKNVESEIASRRYAVLYLYERPYEKDQSEEEEWLSLMAAQVSEVFGISKNQIITKQRKHQKGTDQYEKQENTEIQAVHGLVQEQGQLFYVNLTDYLDSGLFFDHRQLRSTVRDSAGGKSVLNLFPYNCPQKHSLFHADREYDRNSTFLCCNLKEHQLFLCTQFRQKQVDNEETQQEFCLFLLHFQLTL